MQGTISACVITLCVLAAILAVRASAEQKVEVYNGNTAEGNVFAGNPDDDNNTLVWADGNCKEGILTEDLCNIIGAETAAAHANEVLGVLPGGPIGSVEGGDTTLHIMVHDRERGGYDTTFQSVLLPRDWRRNEPVDVVHHETGHAFFDEHLGTETCNGAASSPCTDAVLEHWGTDEGIAMILQKVVGGGIVGPAPADSVDEIMDDHCDIDGYDPGGAADCAHDIGRLLLESFDGLAAEVTRDDALAIYTKAVTEFEGFGRFRENVTFEDLMVNLVRAAPEHAAVIFKQFLDIGVTLPLPTTSSRDEEALPGDSLPGRPVPAAPWWFDDPRLFRCSVSYGLDYKVTCIRRTNDRPGGGPGDQLS